MNGAAVLSAILGLLVLSGIASGLVDGWTNSRCLNSTHLFLWEDIPTSTGHYRSNTTKDCGPYQCNNQTEQCEQPYQLSEVQAGSSLPLYIVLFISGLIGLFIGAMGKNKHIIGTIWATIVFLVLSLQSIALDTIFAGTFFAGFTQIFIMISLLLCVISLLMTLVGMVSIIKKSTSKGRGVGYA